MRGVRAELLQWYGLFGAALIWATQFVLGFGVALADCGAASNRWGIDIVAWEVALTAIGATLAITAEVAAITVVRSTRGLDYDDPPPDGRRHFFAWAAMLGNLLFLAIILLSGIGAIVNAPCHQA